MATTAIYSVLYGVVLNPFPYKDVDRLMSVRVSNAAMRGYRTGYSVDQFIELAERNTIFGGASGVIASTISDVLWIGEGDPQRLRGNYGTFNTFDVMGVPPLLGRTPTAEDARPGAAPVVVLGYRFWQRQFAGDPNVLGRQLQLNDTSRTVIGVMSLSSVAVRPVHAGLELDYLRWFGRSGRRSDGEHLRFLTGFASRRRHPYALACDVAAGQRQDQDSCGGGPAQERPERCRLSGHRSERPEAADGLPEREEIDEIVPPFRGFQGALQVIRLDALPIKKGRDHIQHHIRHRRDGARFGHITGHWSSPPERSLTLLPVCSARSAGASVERSC